MGLNAEFQGCVESMCHGGLLGLLSKTQDEVWNFFEKLACAAYEFDQAKETLRYPPCGECAFLVNLHQHDHYINSYNH